MDAPQSLSEVEIVLFGGARVTSLVAYGMQTWWSAPVENVSLPGDAEGAPRRNGTAVHVKFKSSVISKEVIVSLSSETEFDAAVGQAELPLMVCRDVLRQTGSISVVKTASVEVYEHAAQGVVRAGVGEVPEHIRGRTDRPIVLAYRFLSPRHSVSLSILHHQEMQTLASVVDSALYQLLVTDTQRMHILTLALQNSQRQYMAVRDIPGDATLWSLRVNSMPTTPVRGKNGTLMVPLLVGTSGESNQGGMASKASVELAWMSQQAGLGDNGTLALSPPGIDMPISALSVEVQFPDAYEANFTGTLKRVSLFSHKQPSAVNYQTDRKVVEKDHKFGSPPAPSQQTEAGVRATMPRQGTRYRFERILVVGDNAALSAQYATKVNASAECEASWWESLSSQIR